MSKKRLSIQIAGRYFFVKEKKYLEIKPQLKKLKEIDEKINTYESRAEQQQLFTQKRALLSNLIGQIV